MRSASVTIWMWSEGPDDAVTRTYAMAVFCRSKHLLKESATAESTSPPLPKLRRKPQEDTPLPETRHTPGRGGGGGNSGEGGKEEGPSYLKHRSTPFTLDMAAVTTAVGRT